MELPILEGTTKAAPALLVHMEERAAQVECGVENAEYMGYR